MDIKCVHQTSTLRSALTKWLHNLISSPWTFKVGEIAPEISTLIEVLFPNLNYPPDSSEAYGWRHDR